MDRVRTTYGPRPPPPPPVIKLLSDLDTYLFLFDPSGYLSVDAHPLPLPPRSTPPAEPGTKSTTMHGLWTRTVHRLTVNSWLGSARQGVDRTGGSLLGNDVFQDVLRAAARKQMITCLEWTDPRV